MTQPSQAARTFWTNYWSGLYGTPRAWAHKGENLVHAFVLLADAAPQRSLRFDVHDQALILAGMAAEVMLKAILVQRPTVRNVVTKKRSELVDRERALHDVFYSHGLSDLARAAGLRLKPAEHKTAAVLSQYVYWRGRYVIPTARGIDDLVPVAHEDGLVGPLHRDITMDATKSFLERIIRAVKRELYGEKRSRWRFPKAATV